MTVFLSNILLSYIWMLLIEQLTVGQFLVGFGLGYLLLFIFRGLLPETNYFRRTVGLFRFLGMFLYKNMQANVIVAWETLTPTHHMTPGFVKIEPRAETPLEMTVLAATISLIPGTLTVDTSENDEFLYVHAMHVKDPEEIRRETLEEIEPLILEFLR